MLNNNIVHFCSIIILEINLHLICQIILNNNLCKLMYSAITWKNNLTFNILFKLNVNCKSIEIKINVSQKLIFEYK